MTKFPIGNNRKTMLNNRNHSRLFQHLFALILSCLISIGIFSKFLSADFFLAGVDTTSHDYLMWQWGWGNLLKDLQVPLWNPYVFGGLPMIGSFAFCPFYPPAWLSVALPTSLAITTQYILHIALAAFGFYFFCRCLGLRASVSILAMVLFESSAHITSLANPGHLAKVQAIAWLPWAMSATVLLAQRVSSRRVIALASFLALQLLASHAQIFYATFIMCALYLVLALWANRSSENTNGDFQSASGSLIGFAAASVLLIGMCAVQMFPALEMARVSNRAGGITYQEAAEGSLPAEEIWEIVLPSFRGDSTGKTWQTEGKAIPYLGRWHADAQGNGAQRLVSDYIPIWGGVFALFGICFWPGRKKWFFLLAVVVSLLIAIGDATPLHRLAFECVPGFNRFRSPATFMVVTHFSLLTLCALGLDAMVIKKNGLSKKIKIKISFVIVIYTVVNVSAAIFTYHLYYGAIRTLINSSSDSAVDLFHTVKRFLVALSVSRSIGFFALGLLPISIYLLKDLMKTEHKIIKKVLGFSSISIFAIICIVDGVSQSRNFLPRRETVGIEQYASSNPLDSIVLLDAKRRGLSLPTLHEDGAEFSNRPMMRSVRTLFGYHPVVFGDYERLIKAAGGYNSPQFGEWFALNYKTVNVKSPDIEDWVVLAQQGARQILTRRDPLALARIPSSIHEQFSSENIWEKLTDPDLNFVNSAWIETKLPTGTADSESQPFGDLAVGVEIESANRMIFSWENKEADTQYFTPDKSQSSGARFLPILVSVPAASGWQVWTKSADGVLTRQKEWPLKANGFFMLAPLAAEPQAETWLIYSPASYRWGKTVTLLTLVLCLGYALFEQRKKKQCSQISEST